MRAARVNTKYIISLSPSLGHERQSASTGTPNSPLLLENRPSAKDAIETRTAPPHVASVSRPGWAMVLREGPSGPSLFVWRRIKA